MVIHFLANFTCLFNFILKCELITNHNVKPRGILYMKYGLKKQLIIAYHGMFTPREIARRIPCSREMVYIIWKECNLPYDIVPKSQEVYK